MCVHLKEKCPLSVDTFCPVFLSAPSGVFFSFLKPGGLEEEQRSLSMNLPLCDSLNPILEMLDQVCVSRVGYKNRPVETCSVVASSICLCHTFWQSETMKDERQTLMLDSHLSWFCACRWWDMGCKSRGIPVKAPKDTEGCSICLLFFCIQLWTHLVTDREEW